MLDLEMVMVPFLLMLASSAAQAPATAPAPPPVPPFASRHGGRLFISPMGEPFRPRDRSDDGLADWFAQADRNHDGRLTLDEMQGDAERFFALLDVNHDGEIDPDDISRYEEVIAPEIRSGGGFAMDLGPAPESSGEGERGGRGGYGGGGHRGGGGGGHRPGGGDGRGGGGGGHRGSFHARGGDESHQGASRYGLLDLPEPVVSADADFNRGVSLSEFRQAAAQRFIALDLDHHGYLTLPALASVRPAPAAQPNRNVTPGSPPPSDDSQSYQPPAYK
ncbi:EF-hand domain-containing protein [Sphingomonas sp.]|uniref:EF-hand domain-containing protein n=1 Tax=Sphingomonas sp. TaxID=28214 RepID=UPI0038AB3E52